MRKVQIDRAGGYEQLALVTVADPTPGPDEVVIAVEAAGVNYADCVVRMGLYESAKKYVGWPITPGFEVSGTVCAVGAAVRDLDVGAKVIAVTRFGGYATRVCVSRRQVFERPFAHDALESAGFAAVSLTAYYALHELSGAREGSTVLVHSAAGGVGSALVQLARAAGCRVVGIVGAAHKRETALRMGAHAVIDKSRGPVGWSTLARREAPDGYAAVFDANGASTLRDSYELLASPGRLVVYGFHSMLPRRGGRPDWLRLALDWARTPRFDPFRLTGENRGVLGFNLSYLFAHHALLERAMAALLRMTRERALLPLPVQPFAFERVADAHRALESAQTVGKLVLTMRDDA